MEVDSDSTTSDDEKYSRDGSYHSEDDMDQTDAPVPPPTGDVYILGNTLLPAPPAPLHMEQERDSKKEHPYSQGCFPFKIMRFVLSKLQMAYIVLFLLMVWGTLWGITEAEALPGGNLFSLFVLLISCYLAGRLMTLISLPPLLGMLLMGCFLRNVPYVNFAQNIDPKWASALRTYGTGHDNHVLSMSVDIKVNYTQGNMHHTATLCRFMVGAVSPAVVVSLMIHLQEEGYGVEKGIPVLVIASSSIDDILAITAFGIAYSVIFATDYTNSMSSCSLSCFMMSSGLSQRSCLVHLMQAKMCLDHDDMITESITSTPITALHISSTSCLGCAGGSITWIAFKGPLEAVLGILYGTIMGTSFWFIPHEQISGILSACLAVGLIMRLGASTIAVSCAGFTLSEILFIALAWVPKATVQAALGPIALDEVRRQGLGEPVKGYALQTYWDREPLIKRLPTRDRYTLGGLMSTAIRRARELDPSILEYLLGLRWGGLLSLKTREETSPFGWPYQDLRNKTYFGIL
ncbi:SLC9B2 [Cordylochernes scorpioides]|uniref:SLC9B2 n=1 Tax=Cordylochernes scorpioides TaxID=51811 RepID=A0ABY6L2E3_9ARAC|nr:SLC9B2 [Cordylochernes scorpioides]